MEQLISAGLKRLVVLGVGVAAVALNKKVGLELDGAAQATIATMVTAYLLQSGAKEAYVKGKEASAAVVTDADAAKVLSK
jgi:hypothetical protein